VNDDWRLAVRLREGASARALSEHLAATELRHDLQARFHDRVIVTVDGGELFCYAGTREQAERAQELIRTLAAEHGWRVQMTLKRWHPAAERWEDPDVPLSSVDQRVAERRGPAAVGGEKALADAAGGQEHPPYEVRVELRSHRDTVTLSERLGEEGVAHLRRWRHLLVPAPDEEAANELAQRVRELAPGPVDVDVAATPMLGAGPPNPFVIFGGLAG
jgi:hypothetical protein